MEVRIYINLISRFSNVTCMVHLHKYAGLGTGEQLWAICSCKKRVVRDSLVIRANGSQKTSKLLDKFFDSFPLFMSKSEWLPALFAHLLFFKEQLERFAPVAKVAHDKRAICSFSRGNPSLAHKKLANRAKNWKTDKRISNPVNMSSACLNLKIPCAWFCNITSNNPSKIVMA